MTGAAALAVGNLTGAALGFLIAVLIGRAAGAHGLGAYAAALAWIFPFSLLVDAGLSAFIAREAAQRPQDTHALLRAAGSARLSIGGLAAVLLAMAAPLLTTSSQAADALRLGAPLVMLNPWVSAYTAVFRARRQMALAAGLNVGMLTVQAALTVGLLAGGLGVQGAMLANVLSSAGQWAVAALLYHRHSPPIAAAHYPLKPLLGAAWPFALAGVLAAAQMRMGTALTELWAGAAAVGLYVAAYRFIEAGRLIPQAAFDALLPTLTRDRSHPAVFAQHATRAGMFVAAYGITVGLSSALLAQVVVPALFGAEFRPAGDLLSLMGWAILPMSLKYWAGVAWIARGHEKHVTRQNAAALLIQALVSAVLIPAYAASGAAWALLIGESAGALLMLTGNPTHLPKNRASMATGLPVD